jgi:hypothetical protein
MLQDKQEVRKVMAEYWATKPGVLASSGSGNWFASCAALSSQDEITAIKHLIFSPESQAKLSETAKGLLADALASPDDASIHIVFIAATINLNAFPSQSDMLKPPESMKGKKRYQFHD